VKPATVVVDHELVTGALAVTLTPVGTAMPGLYVGYRAAAGGGYDGFTVSGGTGGGTVAWTAWATRRAVDLRRSGAAALAAAAAAAGPAPGGGPRQPDAGRLSRASLRLPVR
jgi:hypothetical protein